MTRPHIHAVTSNLKSPDGQSWTANLAQRTLIVGSNASHKSSILQAIELALTGAVDDVVWRSVVRDAALLGTMAPGDVLESKVELSNGAVHQFRIESGKRPPGANFNDGVLPIRQVREAVAGSPATARKIFLPWLAGDLTDADLLAHIPAALHNKFKDLLQHMSQGKSKTEALLAIEEYAGKQQRSASKEGKGAQAVIDELTSQMDEAPSDEALAAAEVRLHDLLSRKAPEIQTSPATLQAQLVTAQATMDAASADIETLEFDRNASLILLAAKGHKLEQCPVCSSHVGAEHINTCANHYTLQLVESVRICGSSYDEAQEALALAKHQYSLAEAALAGTPQTSVGVSPEEIQAAQAEYDDLKTAQVNWQTLTAAKRKVEQYEEDAQTYKQLRAACADVIAAIVTDRSPAFCNRVSSFLPKGWEFRLTDKDFRPGLRRNNVIHSALCGAEGAAVITAVAMATAASRPKAEPVVLIPEDRAFDPRTLASVMRGYNKFDGQVIMASTVRPRGRPSKYWVIIDLDSSPLSSEASEVPVLPEREPRSLQTRTILRKESSSQISNRNLRILHGLGFDDSQISLLTSEQAEEIAKAGHLAATVQIENGMVTLTAATHPPSLPPPPR